MKSKSKYAITIACLIASNPAIADSIMITSQNFSTLPPTQVTTTPDIVSGPFSLNVTGLFVPGDRRSPWLDNTTPYSILSEGGTAPAAAIYNFAPGTNVVSFLWGSPDIYNFVVFYSGPNGVPGTEIGTAGAANPEWFTGSDLACYATTCQQLGFDFVTFTDIGGTIGSMTLYDSGQAAFEFSNVDPSPVPGPIVGGGIPGLIALLLGGWRYCRRKP
jgi:hypothetical protein